MFKAVIQEAAALASLALFIGMIAIWTQVLGSLWGLRERRSPRHARPSAGHPRLTGRPSRQTWVADIPGHDAGI